MPYRRRFINNRRRGRPLRKRTWKKYVRRTRVPRKPRTFSFKRTCELATIPVAASTQQDALTFKLSDLPGATEFAPLFDSFRIVAVKLSFQPDYSNSPITDTVQGAGLGSIHTAIDHNDTDTLFTRLDLMQYDTYRRTRMDRIHKRYLKVNTLTKGYTLDDTTLVPYSEDTNWKKWFPTSSIGDAVKEPIYLGLKYSVDSMLNNSATIQVYATYYFQMKSVI